MLFRSVLIGGAKVWGSRLIIGCTLSLSCFTDPTFDAASFTAFVASPVAQEGGRVGGNGNGDGDGNDDGAGSMVAAGGTDEEGPNFRGGFQMTNTLFKHWMESEVKGESETLLITFSNSHESIEII